MKLKALRDRVLVHNMEKGERKTAGGIVLRDDDGKGEGVRARWAQVYSVGKDVNSVQVGQWVYIEHGQWTRGLELLIEDGQKLRVWGTTEDHILLVSDEKPVEFAPRY